MSTREEKVAAIVAEHAGREGPLLPILHDVQHVLGCVDAVSVVTPTVYHHQVASAFLKHGTPVMVEKPVCRTVAEANDLIELAEKAGVALQVGHI